MSGTFSARSHMRWRDALCKKASISHTQPSVLTRQTLCFGYQTRVCVLATGSLGIVGARLRAMELSRESFIAHKCAPTRGGPALSVPDAGRARRLSVRPRVRQRCRARRAGTSGSRASAARPRPAG
ncbi:hypothetical protein FFY45_16250 [Xanthomonas hortorum]|nr:hypothetical protein [Xanthomonas hortorum]